MDADKMDYLLRDAHFAGVRYGVFDLDKVIDACRKYERAQESYLVIQEEGLFAVEQLVLAKQYMTQQVYSHRVRTITDLMIVRGLELAIDDGCQEVRSLYSYDSSEAFLDHYLAFHDEALIGMLLSGGYERSRSLFARLRRRILFKEVALIPLVASHVPDSAILQHLLGLDTPASRQLEHKVAEMLRCEPWEVVVHKKSIKHPAYHEPGGLEPDAIHVMPRDGNTPRFMSQFPGLITAQAPKTERIHVIAPVSPDNAISRSERQRETRQREQDIRQLIFEHVGGAQ